MWHATQRAPGEPALWNVCDGVSNFSGRWQVAQTRSAETGTLRSCGLWQFVHVTPAACILLWRKEPYS